MNNYYIAHHGIKGQRWGVRRFQNEDGSVTPAGAKRYYDSEGNLTNRAKKHIEKEYKKAVKAGDKELYKRENDMYMKAYNKAADKMNSGEIKRFNEEQRKKYGEEYFKREGYVADYEKMFYGEVKKNMSASASEFIKSNSNYKKAQKLLDTYSMENWSEFAQSYASDIKNVENLMLKGI